MITKAQILKKDINGNKNKYLVRIPLFETSGNLNRVNLWATLSYTPGNLDSYSIGDVVYVAFEHNQVSNPVIIGKLYTGNEISCKGLSLNSKLKITDSAELPYNTSIGSFSSEEVFAALNNSLLYGSRLTDLEKKVKPIEEIENSKNDFLNQINNLPKIGIGSEGYLIKTNNIWSLAGGTASVTNINGLGGGKITSSLEIQSTGNHWNEGIRIHPSGNNWGGIVLCDSENTGNSGTSNNTWSIHNYEGTFGFYKNGSRITDVTNGLSNEDGVWQIKGSGTKPKYNNIDIALTTDLPTSISDLSGGYVVGSAIGVKDSNDVVKASLNQDGYVVGRWLQSTAATDLENWTDVWVNDGTGWLYKRSKNNIKGDFNLYKSTEDIIIGRWIDGKNIYRKTIYKTNFDLPNNTEVEIGDIGEAVGDVIDIKQTSTYQPSAGSTDIRNKSAYDMYYGVGGNHSIIGCRVDLTNGKVYAQSCNDSWTGTTLIVIVEYTKAA